MKKMFKSTKTYIWLAIIVIIVAGVLIYVYAGDKAVAEVDGEKISKDELYDTLVEQYGAAALTTLINDKIVDKEVAKEKIKITDKEIKAELDTMIESYGGKETFDAQLQSSGTTEADLKSDIKTYLETVKLLEPRIKITDDEIKTYFEENKDTFAQAEQVEASHILVADEAKAKEVAKKLKDGGDFAKLAKEYSTDTGSAANGGELGYFGKGDMVAEFEKAAFAMKIGEISAPVKSEHGYHIIKVTGKKEAKEATLEDSKAAITETLKSEKLSTEYTTWLTEKQKKYDIYNSLEKK